MNGEPGFFRVFNSTLGGQLAWLIPLALVGLLAGLGMTWRAPRADKKRAGYLMWGLWTLVMLAVLSSATGTFHAYYLVTMAPGVAALAGAGSVDLWRLGRRRRQFVWLLPATVAGTALWSATLLNRTDGYAPGLATAVLVLGAAGALALLLAALRGPGRRVLVSAAVITATIAVLSGPAAYAFSTIGRSVTGNQAVAGPETGRTSALGNGAAVETDEVLLSYLEQNRDAAEFLVAVEGSAASVPIILATGEPVATLGGYKQRDPTRTVAQLAQMVEAGELHFALIGGDSPGSEEDSSRAAGSSESAVAALSQEAGDVLSQVNRWIEANGVAVDGTLCAGSSALGTLYYLP
jgi:4-amino-4-deoxy-L-arabinose transferase-like glycosyltransferase